MSDPVSITKLIAGIGTAAIALIAVPHSAGQAVEADFIILGVSASVLQVAIAGSLIGVMLLPQADAGRIKPDINLERAPRAVQLLARLVALAAAVLGYALVSGWAVAVVSFWFPMFAGAPELPLAGITGVSIRRMLPHYLRVIERVTATIGGGAKP